MSLSDAGDADTQSSYEVLATAEHAQERQGSDPFSIIVVGQDLRDATTFTFDGIAIDRVDVNPTSLDGGIAMPQADGGLDGDVLLLTAHAPHGTTLGAKALTFTLQGVERQIPKVVTVTAISAAGVLGNDAARGTTDSPFESMQHALSLAMSGDIVSLGPGSYGTNTGDSWAVAVPDGITLRGAGAATILQGPSSAGPGLTGNDYTVQDLTVTGFVDGISGTNLNLVDVESSDNSGNGASGGLSLTVEGGSFDGNGKSGLFSVGRVSLDNVAIDDNARGGAEVTSGTLKMSGGHVSRNAKGGALAAQCEIDIEKTAFDANGGTTIVAGIAESPGDYRIVDVVITNAINGVAINSDFHLGTLEISGSTISASPQAGSGSLGLFTDARSSVTNSAIIGFDIGIWSNLVGQDVTDSNISAVSCAATGSLIFGSAASPGHNSLTSSAAGHALCGNAYAGTTSITLYGATLNGTVPAPSHISGPAESPSLYSLAAGDSVTFY